MQSGGRARRARRQRSPQVGRSSHVGRAGRNVGPHLRSLGYKKAGWGAGGARRGPQAPGCPPPRRGAV